MKSVRIHPCPKLAGTIQVPGDKSISHRAVMFSALAEGESILRGLLLGEDVLSTIACFREMGVDIQIFQDRVLVQGVGLHGLKAPAKVLNCGNSGTTLRLMMGILAAQPFTSRLTGDASLNRRPIERVATPLRLMGADIEELRSSETERVVKIHGRPLRGISYQMPMASAQVKSAVLLAGLYAAGKTELWEPMPSRDHTERMLRGRGVKLEVRNGLVSLSPVDRLSALHLEIPGDISSAGFFLVAGCIAREGSIEIRHVGVNPSRTGILEVLHSMGAKLVQKNQRDLGGEPIADLAVDPSSLKATKIKGDLIPRLIDEIPIISIAAARALGVTQIRDAAELRVKESDRIAAIERELSRLGVKIQAYPEGLDIEGGAAFSGNFFQSGGDHRIAMSLAIAATQASNPSEIQDVACVETSYPTFFSDLASLGPRLEALGA